MDVKGKNVFITGSTRGIGKAMALAFAKAGANIILNGRGEIPKEKIEEIEAFGWIDPCVSKQCRNHK